MTPTGKDSNSGTTTPDEKGTIMLLESARKKQSHRRKRSTQAKPKTPRTRKPDGVSLEDWQIALRREFGVAQNFKMKNTGNEPIFSEFIVENPDTGGSYKVAIRGSEPGTNYCSCRDFAVNTLGTCKHIEFALSKLKKKRGAKKAFKEGYKTVYSCVFLRYGMNREVVFEPGTECPAELKALTRDYFDKDRVLKPDKFFLFDEFLKSASQFDHELRCYEDAIQHIAHVRDEAKLRETVDAAFDKDSDTGFRDLLNVSLYPYQKEGALFAARAGRSIIADEMGLGKTVQAIAACEILARLIGIERVLIVCPASLKHQWKGEIEKFVGRPAIVVEGMLASVAAMEEIEKVVSPEEFEAKPASAAPAASQAWAELASAGLAFLDKLGFALTAGAQNAQPSKTGEKTETAPQAGALLNIAQSFIETDQTGRTYLKLPAPSADALKKLADVLYKLSGN